MYKKEVYTVLLGLFLLGNLNAQIGPQQIISTDANGARAVASADFDGDGFKDVVSANSFANTVTWFKNLDGTGSFGPMQIVANLEFVTYVDVGDLDGDGDIDIIATSGSDDITVWYENIDGNGTFGSEQIINTLIQFPQRSIPADIDGDSDLDIVISGDQFGGIVWHENLDGAGNFGPPITIYEFASVPRSIIAADLDGDNDLDIIASSAGSETVVWYENTDGLGTFSPFKIIAGAALTVSSVFAADLDGDNDLDVLATTNANNRLDWYENLDGAGNFGSVNNINNTQMTPLYVNAADIDNDGDMDILCASAVDDTIALYENLDGNATFGPKIVVTTQADGIFAVITSDLNNDGDLDLVSASRSDDKVAWYENQTILGLETPSKTLVSLHPNPAKTEVNIQSPLAITKVVLYDTHGKVIANFVRDTKTIPVHNLASGIYFVAIHTPNNKEIVKLVVA